MLSFAAGTSGGIARDVLIGAIPPSAISAWRYLGISLAAGLLTFYFSTVIIRLWNPVLLFDAVGYQRSIQNQPVGVESKPATFFF